MHKKYQAPVKEELVQAKRNILAERQKYVLPKFFKNTLQEKKFSDTIQLQNDDRLEHCQYLANTYNHDFGSRSYLNFCMCVLKLSNKIMK